MIWVELLAVGKDGKCWKKRPVRRKTRLVIDQDGIRFCHNKKYMRLDNGNGCILMRFRSKDELAAVLAVIEQLTRYSLYVSGKCKGKKRLTPWRACIDECFERIRYRPPEEDIHDRSICLIFR